MSETVSTSWLGAGAVRGSDFVRRSSPDLLAAVAAAHLSRDVALYFLLRESLLLAQLLA